MTNEMNVRVDFSAEIAVSEFGETDFTLAAAKTIADELAKSIAGWKYKGDFEDEVIGVELLWYKPRDTGFYYAGGEGAATYKLTYSCKLNPENSCNDRSAKDFAASICLTAEADICEIGNAYNLSIDTTKITNNSDDWYIDDNGDLIVDAYPPNRRPKGLVQRPAVIFL